MNQTLKSAYRQVASRVPRMGDVDRAIITARRRRTRRAVGGPIAVASLAAVISVAAIATPWSDDAETQPAAVESPSASPSVAESPDAGADACPAGEERLVVPGMAKSVVLGCAQLPDGRKVALLSMHQSRGQCLQIVGLDDHARQCGFAPSAMVPTPPARPIFIQVHGQRNESAPIEVFGDTSAEATMVELRYTRDGSSHEARAALFQVTDSDVLENAGITEPFGYFIAELPPDTSHVTATALDADGQRLGTDGLTPLPWSGWSTSMITGLVVWDGSDA